MAYYCETEAFRLQPDQMIEICGHVYVIDSVGESDKGVLIYCHLAFLPDKVWVFATWPMRLINALYRGKPDESETIQ